MDLSKNTSTSPTSKAQGIFQKGCRKFIRAMERIRGFSVSPRNVSSYTSILITMTIQMWAEQDTNRHNKVDRERHTRSQPYTKSPGNKEMLRVGELAFPREEQTIGCPMPNNTENICMSNILWHEQVKFRNKYV